MFKKLLTCFACIIPFSACSVNFLRGEFSYIDHHIALDDLIRAEWHLYKTGIDPYKIKRTHSDYFSENMKYIPNYIETIYFDDTRHKNHSRENYLFEINDYDLLNHKDFLSNLLIFPCNAKIMDNDKMSHIQPSGLAFPFGRMKNIIRCRKGYYKLEKINENSFVIKY